MSTDKYGIDWKLVAAEKQHALDGIIELNDLCIKKRGAQARTIKELQAKLDEQIEINNALDFSWEQAKERWHDAEAKLERMTILVEKYRSDKLAAALEDKK